MRITRLVAGLVTAGLVGSVPVLVASPAQAVDAASTSTLTLDSAEYSFGDSLYFSGAVKGADGTSTPNSTDGGTASLQILTPANPTWTTIATDTSASSLYFPDLEAQSNASYKIVYSGGVSGFGSSAKNLTPSESAPVTISVKRTIEPKTKFGSLKVTGKITPDFAKKKIKILQVLKKNKTKKFATVKTNKQGKFSFQAPRRNKFKFVVVVPADAMFAGDVAGPYIVTVG